MAEKHYTRDKRRLIMVPHEDRKACIDAIDGVFVCTWEDED